MLLPFILAALPPVLDRLFAVLSKVMMSCSNQDNTHVDIMPSLYADTLSPSTSDSYRRSAVLFLHFLYGMFPSSLLAFLRIESTLDATFMSKMKVCKVTKFETKGTRSPIYLIFCLTRICWWMAKLSCLWIGGKVFLPRRY